MAAGSFNLSDLLVVNALGVAFDADDLLRGAPVFQRLYKTVSSNGTQHQYRKKTSGPSAAFRLLNSGVGNSKTVKELVTLNLNLLDASFDVDQGFTNGLAQAGVDAYLAEEAQEHLIESFKHLERQFFVPANDALGFTSFPEISGLDYINDSMCYDAGGTGDALTSAYIIKTGPREVAFVVGSKQQSDRAQIIVGERATIQKEEKEEDGITGTGRFYAAHYVPIMGWASLQCASDYSVLRIANIDDGDHKLTDDLLFKAWERFPEDRRPTAADGFVCCTKRGARQLRESRTATNTTGAPAPWPSDWSMLPIVETNSIPIGETQVVAEGES